MKSPCKDCERRKVGCHNVDTCPQWLAFVQSNQEAKVRRDEYLEEQNARTSHLKRRGYKPGMR
jgi:hypothetical protein